MDQDLYDLITKAKQGDQDAFASLVERYKRYVYYQALSMVNNQVEAEDVLQEVFIKAYLSIKNLESAFAFTSWLSRIVYHVCFDYLKKRAKEKTIVSSWLENNINQLSSGTSFVEQKHLQIDLYQAMQTLSPEHRAVLLLREIQGFSYQEIARILDIPEGTVKSRIHSARLSLRNELKKER